MKSIKDNPLKPSTKNILTYFYKKILVIPQEQNPLYDPSPFVEHSRLQKEGNMHS